MPSEVPSQSAAHVAQIESAPAGSVSVVNVPTPPTTSTFATTTRPLTMATVAVTGGSVVTVNVTSCAKMLAGSELVSDSVTGVDAAACPTTVNRLRNSSTTTARIFMND